MKKRKTHRVKLSKAIIVLIVVFGVYVAAIFSPMVFLQLRISSLEKIRNANCYSFNEYTSTKEINEDSWQELYWYVVNSDLKTYAMFSYADSARTADDIHISRSYATEEFFELYEFDFAQGGVFDKNAFSVTTDEIMPFIVGYDLRERYKYGEIYDLSISGTTDTVKARVVGIFKENESYIPHWLRRVDVGNMCILPITEDFAEKYYDYADYVMFISRVVVQTDDIQSIAHKIDEIGNLEIEIIPIDEGMPAHMNYFLVTFVKRLIFGTILFGVFLVAILAAGKIFPQMK